MGQKVHPNLFRLGVNRDWTSRWLVRGLPVAFLQEEARIRTMLKSSHRRAMVSGVEFERSGSSLKIIIFTARPGVLIGRGGGGIEEIRKEIAQILQEKKSKIPLRDLKLEVQEVRNPDAYAVLIAQSVAEQIEKRMPFRGVLKRTLERAMSAPGIAGAKIEIAGRLGGSDMSRREWKGGGKIPLHTLRSNIDYAQDTARTTWGAIGVKVWLYKGEIFDEKERASKKNS